ncbi:MAG: nucleoside:proton symporter [Oceanicaulis sp.]|uniref:Sodium dependent nucleoside transporter n=1 Tax=Maricaulis virginensis TaxID=144022 RepID=A0A9W6IKP1_9PROT|nr:nucleoside transporter C-terminal domain-containing protein [Maricaulis virginensis]MBI75149.1 nucleoside:proton symporter [Oceanicaulis sp.]GLK50736.1 sodium dependent nucleoside transporter [Maricaulis virginensis]
MDDLVLQARSFVGLFALAGVAWLLGPRKKISIVLLAGAIALQLLIAWLLYSVAPFRAFLQSLTGVVAVLQEVTNEGAQFVFGYLAGSEAPWEADPAGGSGFLFAFQALPMVIVLSALSALLWRWRILEFLVRGFAAAFRRLLNLSGSASLGAAANIFLGMTESPVLIRPRLPDMTRSDLFLIMTVGFSTVAGSVMALYVSQLTGVIDGAAGHIFTASLISVPAAVLLSRLMMPAEPVSEEALQKEKIPTPIYHSSMDALTTGVSDGIRLYFNIIFMLLVFTALVALVNVLLGLFPDVFGAPLSADRILGWVFAPVVWLAGIPWSEATQAGSLMGLKTALNEVYAYDQLSRIGGDLSERTRLIMTYALCGFANFSSVGILTGGLVAIAPSRREDILQLAPRALISGTLATLMTGAAVGVLPSGLFG